MDKKIVLTALIHPDGIKLLKEYGCTIIVAESNEEEYLSKLVKDVDGIIARGMVCITKSIIESAKNCKVIGRHGVGLETIDIQSASRLKIPVVYTPGANANAVAEHTVCLTLALAKQLCVLNARLKGEGDYECRMKFTGLEISSKTAGIIGLGQIGSRVAEIFQKGFGMRIIGYDPYISAEILEKKGLTVTLTDDLNELFKRSDIVSLHMPGAIDNQPIVGKNELACMKEGAFLINTARGSLIDEAALYDALSSNYIAGAGLDVFKFEPPLPNNPLYSLDNVILTPHTAALTFEGSRNMAVKVSTNVCAVLDGRRINDLANPDIWEERRTWKDDKVS
jgi:D-3-phosphoglycerate dehydrogenase